MSDFDLEKTEERTIESISLSFDWIAKACMKVEHCIGKIVEAREKVQEAEGNPEEKAAALEMQAAAVWDFARAIQKYGDAIGGTILELCQTYQKKYDFEDSGLERLTSAHTCQLRTWRKFFGECVQDDILEAMGEVESAMYWIDFLHADEGKFRELARRVRRVGSICESYAEKLPC